MWNALYSIKERLIDQGGVKELFDHLRNLLIATVIVAAGSYVIRQRAAVQLFGIVDIEFAGFAVLVVGILLAVLNALSGWHQLNKQQWHIGIRIVAILCYFLITMRLVQFIVVLRSK
jgi:hypothetical protein